MRILIASGDSVIGSALAEFWRSKGHDVVCTTRYGDKSSPYYLDVRERTWQHQGPKFDRIVYTIAHDAPQSVIDVFEVNTIGAFEWLSLAASTAATDTAQIAVMTSQFGSIGELSNTQAMWYRMSKAALNMGVSLLQKQNPSQQWMCLHPGLVDTPMSKGYTYTHGKISPETSAKHIDDLLSRNLPFGFYDAPTKRVIRW